jgi:hypothetical protein
MSINILSYISNTHSKYNFVKKWRCCTKINEKFYLYIFSIFNITLVCRLPIENIILNFHRINLYFLRIKKIIISLFCIDINKKFSLFWCCKNKEFIFILDCKRRMNINKHLHVPIKFFVTYFFLDEGWCCTELASFITAK